MGLENQDSRLIFSALEREVRSSDSEKRRSAILQLGEIGNQDAIGLLFHVANGVKRSLLKRFDLEDQLAAITALGNIKNQAVLEFLKNISGVTVMHKTGWREKLNDEWSPSASAEYTYLMRCFYSGAQGELGSILQTETTGEEDISAYEKRLRLLESGEENLPTIGTSSESRAEIPDIPLFSTNGKLLKASHDGTLSETAAQALRAHEIVQVSIQRLEETI